MALHNCFLSVLPKTPLFLAEILILLFFFFFLRHLGSQHENVHGDLFSCVLEPLLLSPPCRFQPWCAGLVQDFITLPCHILTPEHYVLWTLLKIYQLYVSRTGWKIHILKIADKVVLVTCLLFRGGPFINFPNSVCS